MGGSKIHHSTLKKSRNKKTVKGTVSGQLKQKRRISSIPILIDQRKIGDAKLLDPAKCLT